MRGWSVLLLLLTSACVPAIGAGVALTIAAGASLVSGCYEYVNIAVYDGVTGSRVCDARVVVDSPSQTFEPGSCYRTSLGEGRWQVVVAKPGYVNAGTEIVVDGSKGCSRAVRSVRLVLDREGAPGSAPAPPNARTPR